jgi:hypothetical protein
MINILAFSYIATFIMTFAYCDKCLKQKKLYDNYGSPDPTELAQQIDKFKTVRHISLRKAIRIVSFLLSTNQPHWNITGLVAGATYLLVIHK